jgi:hypothetical protein
MIKNQQFPTSIKDKFDIGNTQKLFSVVSLMPISLLCEENKTTLAKIVP